jgi:hypothetical protein
MRFEIKEQFTNYNFKKDDKILKVKVYLKDVMIKTNKF